MLLLPLFFSLISNYRYGDAVCILRRSVVIELLGKGLMGFALRFAQSPISACVKSCVLDISRFECKAFQSTSYQQRNKRVGRLVSPPKWHWYTDSLRGRWQAFSSARFLSAFPCVVYTGWAIQARPPAGSH